jgi:DNA-binding transcriptional MerR regulator
LPPKLLTLPQVAEIVDVEYRTLHSWLKRGLLRASYQQSSGIGVPNLFSAEDVVQAKVIADLRQNGLSFEKLSEAAEQLAAHPSALSDGKVVLVNGSISVVDEATAANSIQHESLTLIYNTKFAIGEMQARVAGE